MSNKSTVTFLLLSCTLFVYVPTAQKEVIDIYRLTRLDGTAAPSVSGSQWLALREINNNAELLPNYEFHLNYKVYTKENEFNSALNHLLDLLHTIKTNQFSETISPQSCKCTDSNIVNGSNSTTNKPVTNITNILPIILGTIASGTSAFLSSVAGVSHVGLFSPTSTSVALSDTGSYPYFYRTIPSDDLQSKGLIFLCQTFNWKRIVVIYANDAYGLHLALGIQQLGKLHNIDVTSIAIQYESDLTFLYAARQVKEIKKYIIILILNSDWVKSLLSIFESEHMLEYPYYYMGGDSWIDSSLIGNKTFGFMGTLPWNINTLGVDEYGDDVHDIIDISLEKTNNFFDSWNDLYQNGYAEQLFMATPRQSYSVYAYDLIYSIAHTIDTIEKEYGIGSMVKILQNNSTKEIIKILHDTLINKVDFVGGTGHITFDENGDRQNAFFSFGNSLGDGKVNYIGYFLENRESFISSNETYLANLGVDSLKSHIDIDKIIWPSYFTEKGIIPHSDIIIYENVLHISKSLSITMFIFCIVFIIVIFASMIFVIYNRKNVIIKRSTWSMNCVMCIGCIISFITAILYGLDEEYISKEADSMSMSILCTFRLYLLIIGFTITVMPLFLKTWRLVQIFNNLYFVQRIYDKQLFMYIFVCIFIDICLLTIFVLIEPYNRVYHNGTLDKMDELQHIQNIYGVCKFSDSYYYYVLLIIWKLSQLLFGIFCALNAARIYHNPDGNKNVLARFAKFDEAGAQLISIALIFIILCIALLCVSITPNESPSIQYIIISIAILLIGISAFSLNLSPRIIAVIKKDSKLNEKYQKSVEQIFKETLKRKLSKMKKLEFAQSSDNNNDNNKKNIPKVVNELISYVDSTENETKNNVSNVVLAVTPQYTPQSDNNNTTIVYAETTENQTKKNVSVVVTPLSPQSD
eukprot:531245_1